MFSLFPDASCVALDTVTSETNVIHVNKWALYSVHIEAGGLLSGIRMYVDGVSVSVTASSSTTFSDLEVTAHWVGKCVSSTTTAGLDLAGLWVFDRALTSEGLDLVHAASSCFPGHFLHLPL